MVGIGEQKIISDDNFWLPLFESTPGLVKVHEGDDADLIWVTTEKIEPWTESYFYHTSESSVNLLVQFIYGHTMLYNECKDRCEYLRETHELGIRISDITTADAKSKYIILFYYYGKNDDAALYVYQNPDKALLRSDSNEVKESDDIRLTCATSSNSLPVDCRPYVTMTYKWTINYQFVDPEDLPDRHSFGGADRRVLLISGIMTEDFGSSYKCIGQEEGSRLESDASEPYVVEFRYAPRLQAALPEDRIQLATVGASVYFLVEALSHPTPNFQWKRIFSNGTTMNLPSDDSGNKSNFTISHIKIEDFGNYSVSAYNEIGRWEDVMFEIRELEKPQIPTELAYKATAMSLSLTCTPGCNGGAAQTFTINYSTDGFAANVLDISDSLDSSQISYKLTEGIYAEKLYSVSVLATNRKGSSEVASWDLITTPGLPSFTVHSIHIQEHKAIIKWTLEVDLVDRVVVKAMDTENNPNFKQTTVTNFGQDAIVIGLPSGSSFIFVFSLYKGDDLLVSQAKFKRNQGTNVGLVVGVVFGLVIISAVLFAAIFFIRRYRNPESDEVESNHER
ncbi:hypothetical protein CAPTEDRAFT_201578 [Capitella teleta]|uniref:Ig-like domain-containing protein n=1 Tax=Capitella teleta TaxID=283909 RepID=R7T483_CAPTE|nr:hypothetical protein CAPTEDRAFT_201578 [Capitella teleta]|eukprot:ELT87643.1 hypothetical protein CAPTEDRAFT_201578 [Capitella teleta]